MKTGQGERKDIKENEKKKRDILEKGERVQR